MWRTDRVLGHIYAEMWEIQKSSQTFKHHCNLTFSFPPIQVIIYNVGKVYDIYRMVGRVQFAKQNPASGNASIDILNLKPEDAGLYQCKVKKLPSIQTHRVQLTVLGKVFMVSLFCIALFEY